MDLIRIDRKRLKMSLLEMGEIGHTASGEGRTRLALTEEDREGRFLFVKWLKAEKLEVCIDPVGNIWGIRQGKDGSLAPVIAGSHLDTVQNAGMFDGALGVLGGLEVIRTLNDHGIETEKPVAVAAFTNEEGARFQPDMMGSMYVSGELDLESVYNSTDDDGVNVETALKNIGYIGRDNLEASAYLELHVEQGPLLFREHVQTGVVQGIQGIAWWKGIFRGETNHAGTTPLEYRKDTLLAVSELCCRLRELASKLGNNTRTTMGRIHPFPDIVNVIPGRTTFTIDLRQYNQEIFEKGKIRVEQLVNEVSEKHGLCCSLEQVVNASPVVFPLSMTELVNRAADKCGYKHIALPSGAGHDAQFMHRICPSGMIFVPSIEGRSHCPEEKTDWDDAAAGVDILLHSILELAGS